MAINFPEGTQDFPGNVVNGTVHTLNTNTSVTWTGIPEGVSSMRLTLYEASQGSNDRIKVYLQDSSSSNWRTSGYEGTSAHMNMAGGAGGRRESAGFEIYGPTSSYYSNGHMTFTRVDVGNQDLWIVSNMFPQYNGEHISFGGGRHGLTAGHRLTGVNLAVGSGTFDNGFARLQYVF